MTSWTPAKTPTECTAGPPESERAAGQPCWGSPSPGGGSAGRKRKAPTSSTSQEVDDAAAPPSAVPSPTTFHHAVETFLAPGCCCIPDALPPSFVEACRRRAESDLTFLTVELDSVRRTAISTGNESLLAAATNVDFREVVDRDGGRRDVRFRTDQFPYICPGLIYNPIVFPLVKELLGGGDVYLLYAGVMWAKPKPTSAPSSRRRQDEKEETREVRHQKWHGDGGHLFPHVHLPPHCINVFYRLVDLTERNGATEFRSGSHLLGWFEDYSTNARFALTSPAGGAVLFDYRVKHRGLSNVTDEGRPVLYLAYAKPFFRDAGNIRLNRSLISSSSSSSSSSGSTEMPSAPLVARALTGEAARMGEGFEDNIPAAGTGTAAATTAGTDAVPLNTVDDGQAGSGERWVLFRMNVEVPSSGGEGDDEEEACRSETITFFNGDVAAEVSASFCQRHSLSSDFVPVLAQAIQQQVDSCRN